MFTSNQVRAGLKKGSEFSRYYYGSYAHLRHPFQRPSHLRFDACLSSAEGLEDTPHEWDAYEKYLEWLTESELAQKELRFMKLCCGWALGCEAFNAVRQLLQPFNHDAGYAS